MEKVLGLDLGTKTLGIAMSDTIGIVHGIETFRFQEKAYRLAKERVIQLMKENNIKEIAIGLPLHLSGEMSEMGKACQLFKERLLEEYPDLKIVMVDERLTSVSAHKTLSNLGMNSKKQKEVVDMIAAEEILNTYMRMRK